jgi:hypothetical protein
MKMSKGLYSEDAGRILRLEEIDQPILDINMVEIPGILKTVYSTKLGKANANLTDAVWKPPPTFLQGNILATVLQARWTVASIEIDTITLHVIDVTTGNLIYKRPLTSLPDIYPWFWYFPRTNKLMCCDSSPNTTNGERIWRICILHDLESKKTTLLSFECVNSTDGYTTHLGINSKSDKTRDHMEVHVIGQNDTNTDIIFIFVHDRGHQIYEIWSLDTSNLDFKRNWTMPSLSKEAYGPFLSPVGPTKFLEMHAMVLLCCITAVLFDVNLNDGVCVSTVLQVNGSVRGHTVVYDVYGPRYYIGVEDDTEEDTKRFVKRSSHFVNYNLTDRKVSTIQTVKLVDECMIGEYRCSFQEGKLKFTDRSLQEHIFGAYTTTNRWYEIRENHDRNATGEIYFFEAEPNGEKYRGLPLYNWKLVNIKRSPYNVRFDMNDRDMRFIFV